MVYKLKIISILFFVILIFSSSDYKAYQIYTKTGKKVDFEDLIKSSAESDFVFFGELHNNPICHWLELELTKKLYQKKKDKLILGAEMFETDDQLKIDEYFAGLIKQRNFESEAKLWPNYSTDYKPFFEFAKEKKLKFVATNIPRRYASYVAKNGLKSLKNLSKEAKEFLPDLPIKANMELESYKKMENMNMGMKKKKSKMPKKMMMKKKSQKIHIAEAQASKDACMSYFILEYWKKKKTFLHFNGTYHSDNYEGIVYFIKEEKPKSKIITIATVMEENINEWNKENENLADFIIVVPNNMTTSY